MRVPSLLLAAAVLVTPGLFAPVAIAPAFAGSDTPPEGPPWVRSLVEAQEAALRKKVPIFVYLTEKKPAVVVAHAETLLAVPNDPLRYAVCQALARCGNADSIEVLAPFADKTQWRNALTKSVVTTLVTIAEREKRSRKRVQAILVETFPDPVEDERSQRIALGLAKHVHAALVDLTGRDPGFPAKYDEKTRSSLVKSWLKR